MQLYYLYYAKISTIIQRNKKFEEKSLTECEKGKQAYKKQV